MQLIYGYDTRSHVRFSNTGSMIIKTILINYTFYANRHFPICPLITQLYVTSPAFTFSNLNIIESRVAVSSSTKLHNWGRRYSWQAHSFLSCSQRRKTDIRYVLQVSGRRTSATYTWFRCQNWRGTKSCTTMRYPMHNMSQCHTRIEKKEHSVIDHNGSVIYFFAKLRRRSDLVIHKTIKIF